jgi:hypothetical protein
MNVSIGSLIKVKYKSSFSAQSFDMNDSFTGGCFPSMVDEVEEVVVKEKEEEEEGVVVVEGEVVVAVGEEEEKEVDDFH